MSDPTPDAVARLRRWRSVQRTARDVCTLTEATTTIADIERACRAFLAAMDALDAAGEPHTQEAERYIWEGA